MYVNVELHTKGMTPLYSASENGHVDVVMVLLEKGANVETATKNGMLL